jgi:3-oxoadipate enol-lactonase
MARMPLRGVTLNYEIEGTGTELLLIHGLGGNLHVWDADAPLFARHHRVLRADVRGFGESDKPPGPYTPAQLADDLAMLCSACGIHTTHVLGISMGGVIAQRLALDHPSLVRSLVLVSTSSEVGEQSTAVWRRLADGIERRGFDGRSSDASRAFSPMFARRHPDVVAAAAEATAANDPCSYAAAARAVSDYRWTRDLERVRIPVLVLQGLDDQLTPPGGSVKMSRALPHARLLLVEEAGHNLPIEQPAVFRSSVLAFTAGVDFAVRR